MASEDIPRIECPSKKGFDVQVILEGFQNCTQPDGSFLMEEYLKGFRELCRFFKLMGRLFVFVAKDLEGKVSFIQKRTDSKLNGHHYATMQSMIAFEIDNKITHQRGRLPSGSRTLIRLQRALNFIIVFMEELRHCPDDAKTSQIAWDVYKRTLSKYHMKIIRKMAYLALHALPTRGQLFELMCKQDPEHVVELLGRIVETAQPLYDNINTLLEQNNLSYIP